MTIVTYNIPNISCGHCVHTIQNEVSEVAGVLSVIASLDEKKATITYNPPATEDQIVAVLTEINYPPAN
jgi:copper chaperone